MMPVGTVIQIEDPINRVRLQSSLIGWTEGQCMLLEQPSRSGQAVLLAKDQPVVGRGMSEGRIWGFKASVVMQTLQPFRILFLTYPDAIEEVSVREKLRVQTRIEAFVTMRKHNVNELRDDPDAPRGQLRNLSQDGCSLACPFPFEVGMPVFLSFELSNGKTVENFLGFVRNVVRGPRENVYGIQFDERNADTEVISGYVDLATKLISRTGPLPGMSSQPPTSSPKGRTP